jgi:tetratricopeptide (TPR) repeat protein
MERKNYRIIFLLFVLLSTEVGANFRSEVYYAYINNKMELWKNVIDRMDSVKGKSNSMLLELVNYQYGYIAYCIGYGNKDEAKKYLDLALRNIDFLERQKYELSVLSAYKSAFYSYRMSINKIFTPVLGIKSIESAKSAVELDKENYFGYVQLGNIEFYTPSAFGGSKKEALKYYLKAKELLEKKPENISENWNYLSLLIVIGQSYYYLKDYVSAKMVYEKILSMEPGFLYIKNELYPQLINKMENR